MKQELLEMFAGECERLAEEKETEREWLSDFANMVLGEAAKVCDEHAADYSVVGTGMYDSMEHGARTCAAAIREMQAPNVEVQRDSGSIIAGGSAGTTGSAAGDDK